MHRVREAFGWLLAAAVLSIGFVPILADETPPATTRIKIDGRSTDWVDRPVVGQDSLADAEPGCIELGTVRAFVNRNALYFLIELDVTDRACEQFDIEFSADHRTLLLSWSPGGDRGFLGDVSHGYEAIGEAAFSEIALGQNLEGRIDLCGTSALPTVSVCMPYEPWSALAAKGRLGGRVTSGSPGKARLSSMKSMRRLEDPRDRQPPKTRSGFRRGGPGIS